MQWRNIVVALESGTLDLSDISVSMLIFQAMYQVGPIPKTDHWNHDLNEEAFVLELCDNVSLVLSRIEQSCSSDRVLHLCISILIYATENCKSGMLRSKLLKLIVRCRSLAKKWSLSIEKTMEESQNIQSLARHLYYINGLIILTFGVDEPDWMLCQHTSASSDDCLADLLRARVIMYEMNVVSKDIELDRLSSLCIRALSRKEEFIRRHLKDSTDSLNVLVNDRWNPKSIGPWSLGDPNYFHAICTSLDGSTSSVHFNVIGGDFLIDGEPLGRLPDRILQHTLFQRAFRGLHIPVFHRGEGVFETQRELNGGSYTFALRNQLIVREISEGIRKRLLDSHAFYDDLPQSLVEDYCYWMLYKEEKKSIELRNKTNICFVIHLDEKLRGKIENRFYVTSTSCYTPSDDNRSSTASPEDGTLSSRF